MKLVTYNIQYGIGRDGRFDLARIASSLDGADIIALQEVTRNFPRNGGVDLVAGLAALLPDHFHVFGASLDVQPPVAAAKRDNSRMQFGNMVLSRWPILSSRNLLLPRSLRLDRLNLQRGAMEALVLAPSGPIRIYSIHLDHLGSDERIRQVRHLRERVEAFVQEGGAVTGAGEFGFPEMPRPEEFVLMGDFNMIQGSPEYAAMTAKMPEHTSPPLDAYDLAGGIPGSSASWISDTEPEKNQLIDFAFVHATLAGRVRKVWIDAEAKGSDHVPVWLEME